MEVWYLFVVEIGFPHAHAPNARSVHYQYFGPNKVTLLQLRTTITQGKGAVSAKRRAI